MTFAARRGLSGAWFFVVSIVLLAGFGALLGASGEPVGWGILVFGIAAGGLALVQTLRPGWYYAIEPGGIRVRRIFTATLIAREDIASVEPVDAARIEEMLTRPPDARDRAGQTASLSEGIRARRELGRIVAFVSVPVVLTRTRRASLHARLPDGTPVAPERLPPGALAMGAKTRGRFVLVTLVDGAARAVSPVDVDGFVEAWRKPIVT